MVPNTVSASPDRQPQVRITMLGGFSLTVAGSTINDSSSRARQLWNLLEYLITFRNRDISHEELISALWPDNRIDNPANALKNLIYRIRSDLAENRVPDSMDFILYKRGTYSYNNSLPTLVDTEEFERLIRTAGNLSLPPEERISLYQAALKLYTGDFLLYLIICFTHETLDREDGLLRVRDGLTLGRVAHFAFATVNECNDRRSSPFSFAVRNYNRFVTFQNSNA